MVSQLQSSLLIALLSLIPNNILRYTAVGLTAGAGAAYTVHLKRPSVCLRHLDDVIEKTEAIFNRAAQKIFSSDSRALTEEGVKLLEVKRSASGIRYRILDSGTPTWKIYRDLCRDIGECVKKIEKVGTSVQRIVEAEHQRQLTEDINATRIVLGHSTGVNEYPPSARNRGSHSV
ncbi:hypothetical protein R3P38DRAFT_3270975 [Favolaschia claudopus]|uniref:Fungal N-terminal domain-containing protein n=1 Tax=Favolaschia claudopus TaxID=2862362 RepID=A0AAW0B8Q3_9AGAR